MDSENSPAPAARLLPPCFRLFYQGWSGRSCRLLLEAPPTLPAHPDDAVDGPLRRLARPPIRVLQRRPGLVEPLPRRGLHGVHRFIRHQAATRPYLNVAEEAGISEDAVRDVVFDDYDPAKLSQRQPKRGPKVDRLPAPRYLGLDEITLVDRKDPDKAHLREARAVLVDLESGNVLALLDDVRAETIAGWFAALSKEDRDRLRGVAIDMSRSYRPVLAKALKAKPAGLDGAESEAWDVILARPVLCRRRPLPG